MDLITGLDAKFGKTIFNAIVYNNKLSKHQIDILTNINNKLNKKGLLLKPSDILVLDN